MFFIIILFSGVALYYALKYLMKPEERDVRNKKTSNFKEFGLLSPNNQLKGKYLDEWADIWWQWVYSFNKDKHPIVDKTGRLAYLGDMGDIYFLGGSFEKKPITRSVTIKKGKAIFFPIINTIYELSDHMSCSEGIGNINRSFNAKNIYLEINGVALEGLSKYKSTSKTCFSIIPESNFRAISTGYWIALTSLPTGYYIISFGGEEGLFKQDITYRLRIID